MSVKDFTVTLCLRNEIKDFIERYHYSGNINGCISDYCFKLERNGELIGALFYGRMTMAGQWKKYTTDPSSVIELRRLVCIDDTPKNTESYFIGSTLRWLKKNTQIKTVVSYSDTEYGHEGTVYKASNFSLIGKSKGAKVIYYNGKRYHDKTIRTKYNGVLKPFALKIKQALETGEAFYKTTKDKNIYVYKLRG